MHCECQHDGYCNRFQREMRGRFRQICAGIDCDIGTSAAFREQWAREAGAVVAVKEYRVSQFTRPQRRLLLRTDQAPGDTVALTAAVYSLHRAYPGRFTTAVESRYPEVWEHNPDVVSAAPDATPIQMHYPAVHASCDRGIHFMQGWCEFLSAALRIHVPLWTTRPHLYFADARLPPTDNFWIICAGGKRDFTAKQWPYYQEVVRDLYGTVKFVQVGGADDDHPNLGVTVEDMVGETPLRELFNLVRRARGVLCGVSLLMHVAAALGKPAIVIAGGREPVQWNAYPQQHYLHTVGAMPCQSWRGRVGEACWRSRTVPMADGHIFDDPEHLCVRPVDGVPECMRMIRPAEVVELILRYNRKYENQARVL